MTKKIGTKRLRIGSWNIKRGLVTKEIELRDILNEEDLDILFLNETDTKQISKITDYQIDGYETVLPKTPKSSELFVW